jgi:hypothetical protein
MRTRSSAGLLGLATSPLTATHASIVVKPVAMVSNPLAPTPVANDLADASSAST